MIGKVTGRVDYVAEDHALIEAAGVGYLVYCTQPTLLALPAPGGVAALYTDLVVREDLMQLYGFRSRAEREWHKLLTSVQGVGAKASLAILGTLGAGGVARALSTADAQAVRAAPGVGPKLATRIVTELKGKAPEVMALGGALSQAAAPAPATAPNSAHNCSAPEGASPLVEPAVPSAAMAPMGDAEEAESMVISADALSALINLGYDRSDAAEAVAGAVAAIGSGPIEEVIRRALQTLAPEG